MLVVGALESKSAEIRFALIRDPLSRGCGSGSGVTGMMVVGVGQLDYGLRKCEEDCEDH